MNSYDDLDIIDDEGHHRVADPELCKIAVQIESAWAQLIPKYAPTTHKTIPAKHRHKVYNAARLCKKQGYDAIAFVRIQIEGMLCSRTRDKVVTSARIDTESWTLDAYHSKESTDAKNLREFESEVDVVQSRAGVLGLVNVIRDPSTPISALTRVVLAWEADPRLLDVVQRYGRTARLEYKNSSVAQAFFADCNLGFLNDNAI